jgi:hypothetical protein
MTFAPNYFASKLWENVGHQELRSTLYKQRNRTQGIIVATNNINWDLEQFYLILINNGILC